MLKEAKTIAIFYRQKQHQGNFCVISLFLFVNIQTIFFYKNQNAMTFFSVIIIVHKTNSCFELFLNECQG